VEKRLYRRAPIDGTARLDVRDQSYPVELLDLSLKGAQVEVASDLADKFLLQTPCLLVLELEDTDIQVPLEGIIVRHSENTLAIEFTQVRVESMQHLRRLVELNLGVDPIRDMPGNYRPG
jgi:hypothetical protein